jgi:hypothetical protein
LVQQVSSPDRYAGEQEDATPTPSTTKGIVKFHVVDGAEVHCT